MVHRRSRHMKYTSTYTVPTRGALALDDQLASRARKKAEALGKSLDQLISECLQSIIGGDDVERNIEEFNRLSGRGNSAGWNFDREEIHQRNEVRAAAEAELIL